MGRAILGTLACPECGFPDAEVKAQKNGLGYRYCPECNAQYFPRTVDASERLLKKCGAVQAVVEPAPASKPEPAPAPASKPEPAPAPKKQKSSFAHALEFLGGQQ